MSASYRDFYFPLNVFMHILTAEEGEVAYLHYGIFGAPGESLARAQERSTAMLFARLPKPPARLLDVGAGVGTTLARLTREGYAAVGITPDEKQVAWIRGRFGELVDIRPIRFEDVAESEQFDTVIFQESSQYIDSGALWRKAATLTRHVLLLDEFATRAIAAPGALHDRDTFLRAAGDNGFQLVEEIDLSVEAAPTMEYFASRIPEHRDALIRDLGVTDEQIDLLIESGATYRRRYADGEYVYRLMQLRRV